MKLNVHRVGLRNIKTALAVTVCMVIFQLIGRENAFYACIAAVICMKDTVSSSFTMGKNRLIGTIIGGVFGILIIFIMIKLPFLYNYNAFVTGFGIVGVIYTCNLFNKPGSVTIACIVLIGIMINYSGPQSYAYAIGRSIDTAIGIIVAILINKYFNPPEEKENNE
ncbi:FUSC family protein [Clostridium sardiniense]|uniref:FUSC family protein n=1 Tax=Clostridium sardiniense TaxID=29369 RepID=UPI003D33B831